MFRQSLTVLLLTGLLAVNAGPVKSSRSLRPNGRIVGGEEVSIEDYPFQVSIQFLGLHECGGVIVAADKIVTAGHCMEGLLLPFFYEIVVGATDLLQAERRVGIRDHLVHPQYDGLNYDFALVWLREDLPLGPTIQPIRIAGVESSPGDLVSVSGWGLRSEIGILTPNILRAVDVNLVNRDDCRSSYSEFSDAEVTDQMVCAGVEAGGKDACSGDSGGPLINARKELIGLVSWGYGCGEVGYPGVYSNVVAQRDWIETTSR